ncbi:hypothetical protein Pla123a_15290 [Posidoniimonas polymericola]|uniref:Uncharacterized protein n=1 Tax=Posidoniimonas polymericola TaxID=2528002 RepID=A0A5C5YSG3_9BACT|nr:hypothetical protein [Posidoniimonas polymericola]TWT77733.1 hypothetical protein Pla123a_15290 [Posidoniimonas polymericola]
MTDPSWLLIDEQGERWTAAVAARLRREPGPRPLVRRVSPLPVNDIAAHAAVFVAIELRRDNALAALRQLQDLRRRPNLAAAALISATSIADPLARDDLGLAALEAGACLTVDSPRRLAPLLSAVRRSLDLASRDLERRLSASDHMWPTERVWRRLPWQAEPWPVG